MSAGLDDLANGRESIEAALVSMATSRLRELGVDIPGTPITDASDRLYELVEMRVGEAGAHSLYNALRRRLASFLRALAATGLRICHDALRLERFLSALGRGVAAPATVYLVGGSSAVAAGWRSTTRDIDLYVEDDAVMRLLPALKEELATNVELASPLDFVPELPGWRDRSRFLRTEGHLTVRDFDFYSQVLSKLERGFEQDRADVQAMVDRGLVEPARLRGLFDQVSDQLYRFPAIDTAGLHSAVTRLGT